MASDAKPSTAPAPSLDEIPAAAADLKTTDIDYIIVGAGPGGAPLASRLAKAGMHVLVLEAGVDPGASNISPDTSEGKTIKAQNQRRVYYCPGLHAAATEPEAYPEANAPPTSWAFDPVHFTNGKPVFYPRASALGGCAAHHAMISIYGLDSDWQKLADLTGDATWLPGCMRTIYQKIEHLRYPPPSTLLGRLWQKIVNAAVPRLNATAQRGDDGWLDVTSADPNLALQDKVLLRVIRSAFFDQAGLSAAEKIHRILKHWVRGNLYRDFDLNDATRMRYNPEGIALVPIAVSPLGVRRGPRELLLETRLSLNKTGPGSLRVITGIFVSKVILQDSNEVNDRGNCRPPRAIGVEFMRGAHIYGASRPRNERPESLPEKCYCRREIILCGGAFNTPQLLMLSGIGDRDALQNLLPKATASPPGGGSAVNAPNELRMRVHLPGVGCNLHDRCEVSVISRLKKKFKMLEGTTFSPGPPPDKELDKWLVNAGKQRESLYTSNGAVIAILKRSNKHIVAPDLLILGFPAAFRGYYAGWSKELFHARKGDTQPSYNLWSWVILKAHTEGRGTVKLRSLDPLEPPEINFQYFGDAPEPEAYSHADMDALVSGIKFVRHLNRNKKVFQEEIQPGPILQEGPALRHWIRNETWGHHPCGTCRMGEDAWQPDPTNLKDQNAVVDSKFRVHGVESLRVVDASVFKDIPGYFIVVSIYMISEKAAATILNELSI